MPDEVRDWRHRALDRIYPIVIFDALRVKIRDADSRMVKNRAVYIALGVNRDGSAMPLHRIAESEGARSWLSVMHELRNLGAEHPDRRPGWAEGLSRGGHRRLPDTTAQAERVKRGREGRRT
ncbi:MAG: transposase [Paracoccus sp. (in: a-proteobacteria)]